MNYRKVLAASLLAAVAVAPSGWSQLIPEMNRKNAASAEALMLRSQELTEKINRAKSQGKDISTAEAERAEGGKAMQQGNDQGALRHFRAGERALETTQPNASGNSGSSH